MAEPNATAATVAATGLTFFGVSTGLDPAILIAGFAGGVWAQSYYPPTALWRRLSLVALASILAGYLAPAAAALAMSLGRFPANFPAIVLQLPLAVIVGLTFHQVLGPAFMRFATRTIDGTPTP